METVPHTHTYALQPTWHIMEGEAWMDGGEKEKRTADDCSLFFLKSHWY